MGRAADFAVAGLASVAVTARLASKIAVPRETLSAKVICSPAKEGVSVAGQSKRDGVVRVLANCRCARAREMAATANALVEKRTLWMSQLRR